MSERLKEIKKELELDWSYISYVVNQDDVKWLINRVEELEQEVNDWRDEAIKWNIRFRESEESHLETKELLYSTISENKRYKQALEKLVNFPRSMSRGQYADYAEMVATEALEREG